MASGLRRWGLEPLLDDEELEVDMSLWRLWSDLVESDKEIQIHILKIWHLRNFHNIILVFL